VRLLLLGYPDSKSWKWDIADAATRLGWHTTHLPARGITADDVVRQAKEADILLWARTHGHQPDGDIAAMLRRVEDAGTVTVGLHLDLYWGIGRRETQIGADPWWTCQWVWTADGGPRDWAGRGVNHRWCPPAAGNRFLGDTCRPGTRHEAVFTGSCSRRIHGQERADLLAWARRRYGHQLGMYGSAGDRPDVRGHGLCGLYRGAGVVLGDSAPTPGYWSDRIPRVMVCGGLLTHPVVEGMAGLGYTDTTLVLHRRGDLATLDRKLDALSPRDRADIAEAGRQLTADQHMWTHRLTQITTEVTR
jgi:hypothetical protein